MSIFRTKLKLTTQTKLEEAYIQGGLIIACCCCFFFFGVQVDGFIPGGGGAYKRQFTAYTIQDRKE